MFQKILVANRGEIALRVICACKELGISTVAVYSEADRNSLHVRFADEAVCIGPARSSESYLNIPQVISAAEITNVDAIHPGYGFLSENANFAKVCEASEIAFIGPRPEIIEMMGEKDRARREVKTAGLPTIPGSEGVVEGEEQLAKEAASIGYPLILKASAGGGGRGMRVVRKQDELLSAYQTARSEAQQAFGTPDVYAEKFLEHPRHIEFQVLGDQHGKVIHLGERECSIQRRHQKLVEESPSPALDAKRRRGLALLHRDEYADSGRASGDRARHGSGSDQGADPHRRRGENGRCHRCDNFCWTCHRVPDQCRGSGNVCALGGTHYHVSGAGRHRRAR